MSNLVPEKRVDKNGNIVTRHVRLNSRPTETKPHLPSPKLSDTRKERVAAFLSEAIHFTQQTLGERNRIEKAARTLTDEDMDFAVSVVNSAVSENGKQSRRIMIRQVLQSGSGYARKLRTADIIVRESKMPPTLALAFLNTISAEDRLGDGVYSLAESDPETQHKVCELARAVTRMTKLTDGFDEKTQRLRPMIVSDGQHFEFHLPALFGTMVQYPERSMEILDWYRVRNDISAIDELLNSLPALGEGAL
jgi:hypothetical protein